MRGFRVLFCTILGISSSLGSASADEAIGTAVPATMAVSPRAFIGAAERADYVVVDKSAL